MSRDATRITIGAALEWRSWPHCGSHDYPLRALYIYISVSERVRVKHDGDDDTLTFDNGSVNLGLLESLWFRKGRPQ